MRRELALAALALTLLGAVVFAPQVVHGGFYWDDWANAANVRFTRHPGLAGALEQATGRPVFGYRPVLTTLLVVQYKALDSHKHALITLAVAYSILTAWALFLLLRTLGVRAREAIAPAALLLVFPWCDSTRMWNTASFDTLAVALFLLGLTLAVRALRSGSRAVTAASVALYLLAAWTYEIVTVAILASVCVYLLVAPRRQALRRFALDAALVAIALAVVITGTTRTPQPAGQQLAHAGTLAEQSFSVLAQALIPVGNVPGVVGAVLAALAVAVALWRRVPSRSLVAAGLGALCVAAGYVLFIPAARYYQPLAPGTTNRMNVLAAVGFAVLVCALVRMAVPRWLAAALVVAIAGGYVVKVRDDQTGWKRSNVLQSQVLEAVRTGVPRPSRHATIYTFGAPSFAAPGIPVFSLSFDLRAAVKLLYDRGSLRAFPIRGLDRLNCGAARVQPIGGSYGPDVGAAYGETWFVWVPHRQAFQVRSRAQCEALRIRMGVRA